MGLASLSASQLVLRSIIEVSVDSEMNKLITSINLDKVVDSSDDLSSHGYGLPLAESPAEKLLGAGLVLSD